MAFLASKNCRREIIWLLQAEPNGMESSWVWGLGLNLAYAKIKLDIFACREADMLIDSQGTY